MGIFSKNKSDNEKRLRHEYRLHGISLALVNDVCDDVKSGKSPPEELIWSIGMIVKGLIDDLQEPVNPISLRMVVPPDMQEMTAVYRSILGAMMEVKVDNQEGRCTDEEAFNMLWRLNNYVRFVNKNGIKTHNLWDYFDSFE